MILPAQSRILYHQKYICPKTEPDIILESSCVLLLTLLREHFEQLNVMIENVIKIFTVEFSLFRSVELPAKLPFIARANAKQQAIPCLGGASNSYECTTNLTEEMHSDQVKFASLWLSVTNNQKLIETEQMVDNNRLLKGMMYFCVSDLFFKLSEN